jgi:hypothetical protein
MNTRAVKIRVGVCVLASACIGQMLGAADDFCDHSVMHTWYGSIVKVYYPSLSTRLCKITMQLMH